MKILLSRILFLLSVVCCLTSCKSTTKTIRTGHSIDTDISAITDIRTGCASITSSLSTSDGSWRITYYDTSLPADPVTGLSPVVAIAEGQFSSRDSSVVVKNDSTVISTSVDTHISDSTYTEEHLERKLESSPQATIMYATKLIYAIAFLLFIAFVAYIVFKIIK